MDIAAMSVAMSTAQTQISASYALMGKTMDATETQAAGLLDMLQTAMPSFGHQMDIRV